MAQEFLRKLLPGVTVFSRGLYGDPTYQVPAKVVSALADHQIEYTGHTSTPLHADDLAQADLIFCVEKEHEELLLDRYPQHTDKIWLLTDFAFDKPQDLADPIGFEGRAFNKQAALLYTACEAAAKRIKKDFLSQP